jgi:hypothetical protein
VPWHFNDYLVNADMPQNIPGSAGYEISTKRKFIKELERDRGLAISQRSRSGSENGIGCPVDTSVKGKLLGLRRMMA